jgi:cytochrome c2
LIVSNGRSGRTLALLAVTAAITLITGGCGGSGKPDTENGRVLFQNGTDGGQACAYCHTLRAALAAGPFGPNLDRDAFRRRSLGLTEADLQDLVRDRIHTARCFDRNDPSRCMPRDLVTGGDATDVAAFVAQCADRASAPGCLPPKPADVQAARGQIIFGSHYCEGCHSTTGNVVVAPAIDGLAGSKVELANGETVTADDDYLMRSILAPDSQIVKGFPSGFMTKLVRPGSLIPNEARALVAYIKTFE